MSSDIDLPPDAIARYVERRKKDLVDCQEALQKGDYDLIARVGHQIKGNALSFGFDELGEMAIKMEEAALKKDKLGLENALQRFSVYMDKIVP